MLALIINKQTDNVISKLENDPDKSLIAESVNFKGDNLLHYACATNNLQLTEYFLKKCPQLAGTKNQKEQFPHDLATDNKLKVLCKSKSRA